MQNLSPDTREGKEGSKMRFDPNEHLMQLKSKEGPKDYLPVQWRLVWFREQFPQGTIDVDEIIVDLDREVTVEAFAWNAEKRKSERVMKTAKGYARYKAIVTDGKGGRATGHGSECAADFSDYVEKAETKAIGRALAGLGYGTQFAPEMNEEHRIVDAPVDRSGSNSDAAPVDPLQQGIEQVKADVLALYPSYKNKPEWFDAFQQNVLGEVPAALGSTHLGKMRSWVNDKKRQAAQAAKTNKAS